MAVRRKMSKRKRNVAQIQKSVRTLSFFILFLLSIFLFIEKHMFSEFSEIWVFWGASSTSADRQPAAADMTTARMCLLELSRLRVVQTVLLERLWVLVLVLRRKSTELTSRGCCCVALYSTLAGVYGTVCRCLLACLLAHRGNVRWNAGGGASHVDTGRGGAARAYIP